MIGSEGSKGESAHAGTGGGFELLTASTARAGEVSIPTTRPKEPTFAAEVVKILEGFYATKQHLKKATEKEIYDLKMSTKLTEAQMQTWFHNKNKSAHSDVRKKMLPTLSTLSHKELQPHTGGVDGAGMGTGDPETDSICEFLVSHKRRLAKEHRGKQEDEWNANKCRISSYLEAFRARKRQLSRTGGVAEDSFSLPGGGTRRKAASAHSASSSPSASSSSSSSASQHGAEAQGAGAGARGDGAEVTKAPGRAALSHSSGRAAFSPSSIFVSEALEEDENHHARAPLGPVSEAKRARNSSKYLSLSLSLSLCTCVYIYIHTYIHTYTHTNIHKSM